MCYHVTSFTLYRTKFLLMHDNEWRSLTFTIDWPLLIYLRFHVLQACEVLSKPQKSLAYLLETYCGVITNKLLQVCTNYA